jgi:phosphatidylglycerophosphatase A
MSGFLMTWPRRLSTPVVLGLARVGSCGKLPAPGTWGSVAGLIYFTVLFAFSPSAVVWVLNLLGGILAVGICSEAEVRLGKSDPGEVVIDEFVAMPLCFLGWDRLPETWPAWIVLLAGFGLFRLLDIVKPLGISRLQRLPGGWGVVVDDVAAALVACAVLHGAARLFPAA